MSADSPADIGRRSARGSLMLTFANVLQLIIAVVTTMIMARVLTPADFGVFAMAMIIYGLFAPVRDFGLPFALVHHSLPDTGTMDALFRINLLCSAVLALIIAVFAWPMATFFDETRLTGIVCVLALLVLIRGSANLQNGLLQRRMAYANLAVIGVVSQLLGAVAGVACALSGLGVGALLWQFGTVLLTETVLFWWLSDWRPSRSRSGEKSSGDALRTLFGYGRDLSASRLIAEAVGQLDQVIVGRVSGASGLGLYQSSSRWARLPLMQLLKPLKVVCVSGISRLQGQPERYREFVRIAFCMAWSLTVPLFVYLAWQAERVIESLLGDQWLDAIPLFRLLALAVLMETADRMANWICLGEGRTRLRLYWNVGSAPVPIVALLIGGQHGAMGVAVALLAARAALVLPVMHVAIRRSPLRHADAWSGLVRPSIATALGALVLWTFGILFASAIEPPGVLTAHDALADTVLLFGHATAFACLYAGFWLLQPGGLALARYCLTMLASKETRTATTKADVGAADERSR